MPLLQRKMKKAFGRDDILQCLPIIWQELDGLKSRVDDILAQLQNKYVMQEKTNEVKQQLLSSKRLREYFNEHPEEKAILQNDL